MAERCDMADRAMGAFGPVRFPVYPPSESLPLYRSVQADAPPADSGQEPSLFRVQGFHAAAKPPVIFLSERRAAVAAGKLVVALEIDSRRQDFMHGHSDAVTCLAHSPEQALGASAQVKAAGAKRAEVVLWCSETMQEVATFVFHQADVEAVGFIQDGEQLVSISADRDHTLALWPSAREGFYRFKRRDKAPLVVISAYKSGSVFGILAMPSVAYQATQFVTFGTAHVKFWRSDRVAKALEGRRGSFCETTPKLIVAAAFASRDRLVAASSEGDIYFFEGTRAVRRLKPHGHSVALLLPLRESLLVVYSRGLCTLLKSDRPLDINLYNLKGAPDARMQTPFVGGASWKLSGLLLSSRTDLLFLDLADGLNGLQSVSVLMTQPSKPLTAVCAHPLEPRIFTGALDGGVRCYRSDTHLPLPERCFKASGGVTCLAVSKCLEGDSAWLAVGCDDSTLSILGETPFRYVLRRCLSATGARLTCARFSPCSASHPLWLAVGTSEGCIHTFKFKEPANQTAGHTGAETVVKVATLRGHAAPVVDISFADALPCTYLMSVDASGQALAFDVPMGRRMQSVALVRDVMFSPWTAPIGWQVLGCWEPAKAMEGATLPPRRFCEVAGRSTVAATDSSLLAVELYPFPCPVAPELPPLRLTGPASPVTSLLHTPYSDCLLAASDTVLFAWSFEENPTGSPIQEMVGSPLRTLQGSAVYDTPEGKKHAMAAAGALTPTPCTQSSRRGSLKENVPSGAKADVAAGSPQASARSATPVQGAGEPWAQPRPAARTAWAIQKPARPDGREAPAAGRRSFSSPSASRPAGQRELFGARESAEVGQPASSTAIIREENSLRARRILERQQFDTVGLLLSGQEHASVSAVVAPPTGFRESLAGRFQLRMQNAGTHYEVEAQLPGGQLLRVLRNPLRRTLTFEGELRCKPERLLVQVPPGFDLEAAPEEVHREFEEGRCFIAVRARPTSREAVPAHPQTSDFVDSEV